MAAKAKHQVGEIWEIKTDDRSVQIERPDGAVVEVVAVDGVAVYALTTPGDYRAGTHHVTATTADNT